MIDVLVLLVGVALAIAGGDLFVRGVVGLAAGLRVPPGIIAATVAAFATSSPELAVALSAALDGRSAIAVGDALGSNVVNLGLVLGAALLVAPLVVDRPGLRRNMPFAMAAPVVTALLLLDGTLSRADGGVLLAIFALWLSLTVRDARRNRFPAGSVLRIPMRTAVWVSLAGVVLLVAAGQCIVIAAKGIGAALGWDEFVVGATLVALGTSTPELATTLVARLRGHEELGLATLVGSNIFNNLWIVGVATVISPAHLPIGEVAIGITAGIVVTLLVLPSGAQLSRRRGVLLLTAYVVYLAVLLPTA